jgi:mRNA-degrading endonuclease YafQ of YafQ-DinJ toxin-antitoxin module
MIQTTTMPTTIQTKRQENHLAQAVQEMLADLALLPPYEEDHELYRDWGEEREFKVQVGRGECAQ